MTDKLKKAYTLVLDDILNSDCGMLVGKYDARNGDKKFMYGINVVMEFLAYKVSDSVGDNFSKYFIKNMQESEKRAEKE